MIRSLNSCVEMDQQALVATIGSILLVSFLLLVLAKRPRKTSRKPLPGPRALPLIGNIHQMAGAPPHKALRDLSLKHGPLMQLHLGELSVVVASSPAAAKQVLKDHELNFSDRPYALASDIFSYNFQDIAMARYGHLWRHLRKICTLELLSAKRVHMFRHIRDQEVLNLRHAVAASAGRQLNLSKLVFSSLYHSVSRAAVGGKGRKVDMIEQVAQKISDSTAAFSVTDLFPSSRLLMAVTGRKAELEKVLQEFDDVLESIIAEHIEARKFSKSGQLEDDLVHVLLNLKEDPDDQFPLTITNIKAVLLDLLLGGSTTSSTTVEWAMSEMLKKPAELERAQTEVRQLLGQKTTVETADLEQLTYLKLVVKETLRLHPSIAFIPRASVDRCENDGYEIPANSRVVVNAWAIGRDPDAWSDPDSFNPERFRDSSIDFRGNHFEYVPFGVGRRICPGMLFATVNVELVLANLLYYFDWKLPNGQRPEDLDMTERFSTVMTRETDLCLIPTLYTS